MKEYLKMRDVFYLPTSVTSDVADGFTYYGLCGDEITCYARFDGNWNAARYSSHAINSHDELVAEVYRLRAVIQAIKNPTNDDCLNFLCAAFRHCDYTIKGDFEIDDMKPAFILYANNKGA